MRYFLQKYMDYFYYKWQTVDFLNDETFLVYAPLKGKTLYI